MEALIVFMLIAIAYHLANPHNEEAEAAKSRVNDRADRIKKYGIAAVNAQDEYFRREPEWPREFSFKHWDECKALESEVCARYGIQSMWEEVAPKAKPTSNKPLMERVKGMTIADATMLALGVLLLIKLMA